MTRYYAKVHNKQLPTTKDSSISLKPKNWKTLEPNTLNLTHNNLSMISGEPNLYQNKTEHILLTTKKCKNKWEPISEQ